MRKVTLMIFPLIIAGSLVLTGCKKKEDPEPSKEKTSQTAPTEPAPVPKGTPPY